VACFWQTGVKVPRKFWLTMHFALAIPPVLPQSSAIHFGPVSGIWTTYAYSPFSLKPLGPLKNGFRNYPAFFHLWVIFQSGFFCWTLAGKVNNLFL